MLFWFLCLVPLRDHWGGPYENGSLLIFRPKNVLIGVENKEYWLISEKENSLYVMRNALFYYEVYVDLDYWENPNRFLWIECLHSERVLPKVKHVAVSALWKPSSVYRQQYVGPWRQVFQEYLILLLLVYLRPIKSHKHIWSLSTLIIFMSLLISEYTYNFSCLLLALI